MVPWVLRAEPSAPTNSKLCLGIRSGALMGEFLRILSHASFRSRVTAAPVSSNNVRLMPLIRLESLYPPTAEAGHRFTVLE